MPKFQIRSPDGYGYCLDSSDPEIIGKWFTNLMAFFGSSGYFESPAYNMFTMQVWPLFIPDRTSRTGGRPDWCGDTRHSWCHDFTFDGTMQGLVEVLNRHIETDTAEISYERPHP